MTAGLVLPSPAALCHAVQGEWEVKERFAFQGEHALGQIYLLAST